LQTAAACVEAAELVLDDGREEFRTVAAQMAVLAGIAASDAICCRRLGKRHRGDDHRRASDLLRAATPSGAKDASTLSKLLDLKDEAHYGVIAVSASRARSAVKWAKMLVARASAELER
jgi:hypothetical protein